MTGRCLFCDGNPDEPNHYAHCDGRQGRQEALYGQMGDVPYERESATSAAAAATIDGERLARLEARVFEVLARRPQTCDAVELSTGLSHQTVSARIRGLVQRHRVMDSGRRAPTRSGRLATVWKAKETA
jgi:hypothetical protein